MTPSKAAEAVDTAIAADRPLILWGDPGIGKSEIVAQAAARHGAKLIDIRGSLLDAVDLRGLPTLTGGITTWARPCFFPPEDSPDKWVILLDEINRATPMVQNGLLQLALDKKVGEAKLPPSARVIAAANYDGGGCQKLHAALTLRFIHIDMKADLMDWCKWAATSGIHPAVIGFLRWRPEQLHRYDPKARSSPNPRCWKFVSDITHQNHTPQDVQHELFTGTVGEATANDYQTFLKVYQTLPSVDMAIMSPDTAPLPPADDPCVTWAMSQALAIRATVGNMARIIRYAERLPQEFGLYCIKDALDRQPMLDNLPDVTTWKIKHPELYQ